MPSRKVLRRAARHVDYEIAMLLEAADRLRRLDPKAGDPVLRGALLESWGVHLRALLDFFQPGRGAPDGIIQAGHYLRDPQRWARVMPRLSRRERRRQKLLPLQLGQLTYRRHPRLRSWSEGDHDAMVRRIRLFLRHLSSARRRWFPRANRKMSDQMDLLEVL